MVGRSIQKQFAGVDLNGVIYSAKRSWRIVGIFDAGPTGYSSEIWGDASQFMQAFRRPVYSSITFKLRDPSLFAHVRDRIATDPRLKLDAKRETTYYTDQSEMMAKFLRILGFTLTLIFSVGAIIGAMITMYASIAHRVAEIGTLRALGFRRRSILTAFLIESLLLGFFGGVIGLGCASLMQFVTVSTLNFQTFSELAFRFTLSPPIIIQGMLFSLVMGFIGGFLPALRASRMKIVDALRAT
jgi:ABC-type antimicrobial peptide transport system permease subunit